MRTTVILDDKLVDQAREETGIQEKTALLHAGLKALVSQAASRRLARLGGTQPDLQRISRRRSGPTKCFS